LKIRKIILKKLKKLKKKILLEKEKENQINSTHLNEVIPKEEGENENIKEKIIPEEINNEEEQQQEEEEHKTEIIQPQPNLDQKTIFTSTDENNNKNTANTDKREKPKKTKNKYK